MRCGQGAGEPRPREAVSRVRCWSSRRGSTGCSSSTASGGTPSRRPIWSDCRPTRRQAITLALYALARVAIVGGRGWFLANALGGRYPLSYLIFDVAAFAAVLALLRVFDALLKGLARRVFGERPRPNLHQAGEQLVDGHAPAGQHPRLRPLPPSGTPGLPPGQLVSRDRVADLDGDRLRVDQPQLP